VKGSSRRTSSLNETVCLMQDYQSEHRRMFLVVARNNMPGTQISIYDFVDLDAIRELFRSGKIAM
jgi:hypothetical protein